MSADADFADYAHARWPTLVAALEAEGVAPDVARVEVARALLSRRKHWDRLLREEDVDVAVWQELRDRTRLARRPGEPPPLATTVPQGGEPDPLEPWLTRAAALRRQGRRRGARRSLVALAVGALVLAGIAWWDVRPRAPAVREEANPLPVVWYAGDELHLAEVVVELPGVETFVAVGSGAVVRRVSGEVVRVDASGEVTGLDDPPDSLDEPPELPDLVPVGGYAVVLQGAPLPDGGWAYVLHAGRAPREELRRSEAGQRIIVLCDAQQRCRKAETGLPSDSGVRLR